MNDALRTHIVQDQIHVRFLELFRHAQRIIGVTKHAIKLGGNDDITLAHTLHQPAAGGSIAQRDTTGHTKIAIDRDIERTGTFSQREPATNTLLICRRRVVFLLARADPDIKVKHSVPL